MSILAIKGHATRGSEVIALLEMLGGINSHNLYGDENYAYYTIDSDKEIKGGIYVFGDEQLCHFTLEEFLEKFPYKVGDKVKNAKVNDFIGRITNARWDCNEEQIIYTVEWDDMTKSTLNYFARGLQSYKEKTMETITIDDFKTNTKEWLIDKLHGMIISDAIKTIGDIHDELHKPKYPKTYEECCNILQLEHTFELKDLTMDEEKLIDSFIRLKRCRDAYWKMAGELMGLGKPWKPDWKNDEQGRYKIMVYENKLYKDISIVGTNFILVFPSEEMRDAFYENFKNLIEECKELL